jgi:hypothetical protein
MGIELSLVARDDAGRLLSAVLKRVQSEIRHIGGFLVSENSENAALVVKVIVVDQRTPGSPIARFPARRVEDDEVALWIPHQRNET